MEESKGTIDDIVEPTMSDDLSEWVG